MAMTPKYLHTLIANPLGCVKAGVTLAKIEAYGKRIKADIKTLTTATKVRRNFECACGKARTVTVTVKAPEVATALRLAEHNLELTRELWLAQSKFQAKHGAKSWYKQIVAKAA